MIKKKFHLAFLISSFVFYISAYGQANKQADTMLLSISKKLDVIDKKLSDNLSTRKESGKDFDLKKDNKILKKEIEDLNDTISSVKNQYKKQKEFLQAKESENKVLKIREKAALEKEKADLEKEKAALEKEIAAILNQGHTLPQNLIISLQDRSYDSKAKPSNQIYLTEYTNAHKKINETYLLLNSAYDGNKVKEANILIEKINLDAITFSGLMANKKELISLLGKYCEKTNELSKIIEDAKVKSDENRRKDWLEGFTFKTKGIPYLSIQLEKAIKDRNYKLEKVNCQ